MVLPFSNWQLQLPDYFLFGYTARVLLWLAYTAVMSKASSVVDEVEWLMFRPVKHGRPGEYMEVGHVEEPKGHMPTDEAAADGIGGFDGGDDGGGDDSDEDSDSDDDDEGSGEDLGGEAEEKENTKKSKQRRKPTNKRSTKPAVKTPNRSSLEQQAGDNSSNSSKQRKRPTDNDSARSGRGGAAATSGAGAGGGGSGSSEQSMGGDVRGSEAVRATVNGESVLFVKAKPKDAASGSGSSGSGSGGGVQKEVTEGMHAMDIDDRGGSSRNSSKAEKKGR